MPTAKLCFRLGEIEFANHERTRNNPISSDPNTADRMVATVLGPGGIPQS